MSELTELLQAALAARASMLEADPKHESACRLFAGFYEGEPDLAADLYGRTLVLWDHAEAPVEEKLAEAQAFYLGKLPWLRAVLAKARRGDDAARAGVLRHGAATDLERSVREHGVRYALDLRLNQDASLYLDTRNLRAWALQHLAGKSVLNTFAYTGSLGVAARAAGARRVVQLDLSRPFLNVAKQSYALNNWPVPKIDFRAGDFFELAGQLRKHGELFDCAFVDPPFFSATDKGTVDLLGEYHRVLNKVRPLLADQGWLVAVNNALYLSGAEYQKALESLCADGYLAIEELIPVPEDFTGSPATRRRAPPADPAPFNHPTKIAVLRVKRKDGRAAT